MTVQDLINQLQSFSPNTRVVVNGYPGGYNDIYAVDSIKITLNTNKEWWYGRHDSKDDSTVDAIHIH